MKPWTRVLVAALLLSLGVVPLKLLVDLGGERQLTWESVSHSSRQFFSNVFLGGVDEDGDGKIGEGEDTAAGFYRSSVLAAVLVGVACGLLGSFITLRRMALFGDMLGHAVLPGVAVGFIAAGSKSTPALLVGALGAGLLAAALTRSIRGWSRVKEDAALGISLTLFYAIGVWLLFWITRSDMSAESSGLDQYLFGNAAVINPPDLWILAVAALIVVLAVWGGFKELLASSFDPAFSASVGLPRRAIDAVLLVLLTLVIVVSIEILGVVLVGAMLTIPPATAYLLTERLQRMCVLSALLGAVAGFGGTFVSRVLGVGVGPAIVTLAFAFLVVVFVVSPRHGVLDRFLAHRGLVLRTARENLLAAVFRAREKDGIAGLELPLERIATERREPIQATRALAVKLGGSGWGHLRDDTVVLTPEGEQRAREIVRTHRLWELFLSREASLPSDHVHPDAEEIEHYLSEEALEELERLLEHPRTDPHGREIPASGRPSTASETTGETGETEETEKAGER